MLECNEELSEAKLDALREAGIESFEVLFIDGLNVGSYLRDTLMADKVRTQEDAILEIYRRLRPGDPPTLDTARQLFHNLFFNEERYDLSRVGRLKLNYKFYREENEEKPELDTTVLTPLDILHTVTHLIELKNGRDIDVRRPGFFMFRQKSLLNNIRQGGCEYFNTVLGPGYNADHADHFHFDIKERRNGYAWYGGWGESVARDFAKWPHR